MVGVLNLSTGSTMALHAALHLSKGQGAPITTRSAAEVMKVSEAHLSKILQRLHRAGIVKALRGPKGGYVLNKPLAQIRLLDVFEAIDGPMKFDVRREVPDCQVDGCMLGTLLRDINRLVVARFELSLAQL